MSAKSLDKVKSKIRKLLATGQGGANVNEAAIAMRQARYLMDQHKLSENDVENDPMRSVEVGARAVNRAPSWACALAYAVASLNDCRSRTIGGVRFEGRDSDVTVAAATYEYLESAMKRQLRDAIAAEWYIKSPRAYANAFRVGFAYEINDRVGKMVKERERNNRNDMRPDSNGRGLVPTENKLADIAEHFGVIRYSRARSVSISNSEGLRRGVVAGGKTSLNTQVHGTAAPGQLTSG